MNKEAKEDMRMWIQQGWNLKEETSKSYVLTKNTQKLGIHVIIFMIMALSTMSVPNSDGIGLLMPFIGNIIYYFVSSKKKIIPK